MLRYAQMSLAAQNAKRSADNGSFGASLLHTSSSSMTSLLSVTEKVLPLISRTIELVDGTNVAEKLVLIQGEAADGLKVLSDALKGLETQILQVKSKVGELVNEAKGRGFKKLLRDENGQKAMEDLRSALEETFDYLKRLAAGAKDNHSPLTELSYDEGSLVFIQASLWHSLMSPKVDDAVSCLRSIQSEIEKYKDKVDDAFLRTMELYNLIGNQQPRTSSTMLTIRDKFIRLLKPRHYRRTGADGENRGLNGDLTSAIAPNVREAQETSSPYVLSNSLLLQLPPELLIIIITVLNNDSLEDLPRRINPLPTLRLTCKTLANLCAPLLFRSISLKEDTSKRRWRLAKKVQGLGEFVHEVRFTLKSGSTDGKNSRVYQMLAKMPNIRAITVIHEPEDIAGHTALLTIINQLLQFESLTLQDRNYHAAFNHLPFRHMEVARTFFHQFLHNVVKLHGHRLKTLHLFSFLPLLSEDLYIEIRDFTPNLRQITFSGSIGVELRSQFAEPISWASGKTGSLESLTLHNCTGVHAGNFTQNVIRGVYGNHLKSVCLVACGYSHTDIPSIPTTSTPNQVTVDRLHLDHMTGWELEALSLIPVQDLSLTRLFPGDLLQLPTLLATGFAGMKKMRLIPKLATLEAWKNVSKEAGGVYTEVQERCLQRGVQLSFDVVSWPNDCIWHMHI